MVKLNLISLANIASCTRNGIAVAPRQIPLLESSLFLDCCQILNHMQRWHLQMLVIHD